MTLPPSDLTRAIDAQLRDLLRGPPSDAALVGSLRLLAKWRARLLENTLRQRGVTTIQSGPFAGMSYALAATEGGYVPRLLGCYEASLAPVIAQIVAQAPDLIIDVGCAEGYYAVGLARLLPQTTIWARDANPDAQTRCAALAAANHVSDQIKIGGIMAPVDFDVATQRSTVVICDIEGAEAALMDPKSAAGLQRCNILVETHPGMAPGVTGTLQDRFARTHDITRIDRTLDTTALPDWAEALSDLDRLLMLWEWRAGPTPWLWMKAKSA